jgi:hypothetical protein
MTDMRQIQCFVMYHSFYCTCANCSVFCRSESFIIWFNSNSCCHHAWGTEKMTMTLNHSLTRSFDLLDETLWVWENFSKSWDTSQALNSMTKFIMVWSSTIAGSTKTEAQSFHVEDSFPITSSWISRNCHITDPLGELQRSYSFYSCYIYMDQTASYLTVSIIKTSMLSFSSFPSLPLSWLHIS